MKNTFVRMLLIAALAGVGMAKAEQVYVVETSDFDKKVSRDVKTAAEFKELKKTVDAELRVFPKALELVKKDWESVDKGAPAAKPAPGAKAEKPLPSTPFPSSMLAPRKCQSKGEFSDREKAQKHLEQLEMAETEQLSKEAKKNQGQKLSDADKAKQTRAAERAAAATKAAPLLQAKIDELLKGSTGGAATNAVPAAAPAAVAPAAAPKK